ncbi:MAG: MFS transporter [Clostridia bacterium]|nr:MFS transporter [Clostridia bacterium]
MAEQTKLPFGERVKRAVGVEGDTKTVILPMIAYTITNMATSGASYFNGLYYIAFLTYVEGLSGAQVGLIMLIKSIWDAVTDPMMGMISDRTRSKWGRHRVYIVFGALPYVFTFFMTWYSFGISAHGSSHAVMLYYIAAYILYSTASTVIQVPHTAMLPELAPDYFLRTQYNSIGYLMNSAGMVPSFLIASAFLGLISTKDFSPALRGTFTILGVILSLFYMIPIFITGFRCKERSSLADRVEKFDGGYVLREYKQVFKNKAFRQYFTISVLYMFALGFYNNAKVYFLRELADVWSAYNIINIIAGVFEASGFPLNFALTKKYGKQRCAWVTTPFLILSFLIMLFINGNVKVGGLSVTMIAVFIHTAFYSFGLSGMGFTTSNSYPDVTDVDELITGRRREGVIATFSTFIKKVASGFMGMVVLTALEWFGVATSSSTAMTGAIREGRHAYELFGTLFGASFGIKLMGAVIPTLFILLALLALKNYKMTKESHTMIRALIATRHKYGRVDVTDAQKAACEQIAGRAWDEMWISTENAALSDGQPHYLSVGADGKYLIPEKDENGNYVVQA